MANSAAGLRLIEDVLSDESGHCHGGQLCALEPLGPWKMITVGFSHFRIPLCGFLGCFDDSMGYYFAPGGDATGCVFAGLSSAFQCW
jgi:hypothetical protein